MNRALAVKAAFFAGVVFMALSLFNVTVTVAGDYSSLLRWALLFGTVSAVLFAVVAVLGSTRWRVAAVLTAIPLVYVLSELVRRGL